jgi:predicted RNA binding protein YcfA (HicA-like mRNA interferase family)
MPKVPRDISGAQLAQLLNRYGYNITRQTGSHLRLVSNGRGFEHKVTIPDHQPIKIGTLNNILADVADYLQISKRELLEHLFGRT